MRFVVVIFGLLLAGAAQAQDQSLLDARQICFRHIDANSPSGFEAGFESCAKVMKAVKGAEDAVDLQAINAAAAALK